MQTTKKEEVIMEVDMWNFLHSQKGVQVFREYQESFPQASSIMGDVLNKNDHFISAVSLCLYLALKDVFKDPGVEEVNLEWSPHCEDNGGDMVVMFDAHVKYKDLPFFRVAYAECPVPPHAPPGFEEKMIKLVGAGEMVIPAIWNDFHLPVSSFHKNNVSLLLTDAQELYSFIQKKILTEELKERGQSTQRTPKM